MPIREAERSRDAMTTAPGMVRLAAVLYVLVGATLVIFLVALASGASWAKLSMGRVPSGALTVGDRLLSLLAALAHVFFVAVVATSARLVWPQYSAAGYSFLWVVAFYNGLATLVQATKRSGWSRRVWAPTCLVLTACAAVVLLRAK